MMFLFFLINFSREWSGEPHEMIAQIALQMLSKKQRNWITNLLTYWPSEEQDINLVANWQDMIISDVGKIFQQWHFADTPYIEEGFTPDEVEITYNITEAITDAISSIMDESTTSIWSLIFNIRNLLHFVGDSHCPVHSVTYYGVGYESGDAGGNFRDTDCSLIAEGSNPYFCSNLHKVWDSAILNFDANKYTAPEDPLFWENITIMTTKYPEDSLSSYLTQLSPYTWVEESYQSAIRYTYGNLYNETYINQKYVEEGFPEAQKRITLAGYRLGTVLKQFFDERGYITLPSDPVYTSEIIAWILDSFVIVLTIVYLVLIIRDHIKRKKWGEETQTGLIEAYRP